MTQSEPEPQPPAPSPDERQLLLGFLRWKRDQVVATLAGLTDEQLRWSPAGGPPSLLGLVNHLTRMEARWVTGRYLGEPSPTRTDEEFTPGPELGGAAAIAAYRARAAATEQVVRAAPGLGDPCRGNDRLWPGDEAGSTPPLDLRWVLLHVLEETAQHAGHADVTRQLLDGAVQS